ncbi:hypothetical protein EVG20_g587 [Dentipellis fragilis]|uniref:Small ribosomal subunit protein mS23 n=1 Tax=Dentipellis fragilis TaxID=205917 RepID=A0A4Y9ZE48_9AGAM|nr:hypothetical protein EVG20_g587 [Dentipellis fragilis]
MGRRIASQVHKQASRLMRANYIKERPAWYQAVLEHPPLPLPPRAPPPRTSYDTPVKKSAFALRRTPGPRPAPVSYVEDDIRRQFFRDHPFEAFRPISLMEGGDVEGEHPIRGKEWTRLKQRGRSPSPEDAVRFAVNLHEYHDVPLTEAYKSAVAQFRALRSEHHIATVFAAQEAESYGAVFAPSATEKGYEYETKVLTSDKKQKAEMDEREMTSRKRWRMENVRGRHESEWTKGQEYVRLWKQGVRPDYSPALTEPIAAPGAPTATNTEAAWLEEVAVEVQAHRTPA